MDQIVVRKFFKQTLILPKGEEIINNYSCTLDAHIKCIG